MHTIRWPRVRLRDVVREACLGPEMQRWKLALMESPDSIEQWQQGVRLLHDARDLEVYLYILHTMRVGLSAHLAHDPYRPPSAPLRAGLAPLLVAKLRALGEAPRQNTHAVVPACWLWYIDAISHVLCLLISPLGLTQASNHATPAETPTPSLHLKLQELDPHLSYLHLDSEIAEWLHVGMACEIAAEVTPDSPAAAAVHAEAPVSVPFGTASLVLVGALLKLGVVDGLSAPFHRFGQTFGMNPPTFLPRAQAILQHAKQQQRPAFMLNSVINAVNTAIDDLSERIDELMPDILEPLKDPLCRSLLDLLQRNQHLLAPSTPLPAAGTRTAAAAAVNGSSSSSSSSGSSSEQGVQEGQAGKGSAGKAVDDPLQAGSGAAVAELDKAVVCHSVFEHAELVARILAAARSLGGAVRQQRSAAGAAAECAVKLMDALVQQPGLVSLLAAASSMGITTFTVEAGCSALLRSGSLPRWVQAAAELPVDAQEVLLPAVYGVLDLDLVLRPSEGLPSMRGFVDMVGPYAPQQDGGKLQRERTEVVEKLHEQLASDEAAMKGLAKVMVRSSSGLAKKIAMRSVQQLQELSSLPHHVGPQLFGAVLTMARPRTAMSLQAQAAKALAGRPLVHEALTHTDSWNVAMMALRVLLEWMLNGRLDACPATSRMLEQLLITDWLPLLGQDSTHPPSCPADTLTPLRIIYCTVLHGALASGHLCPDPNPRVLPQLLSFLGDPETRGSALCSVFSLTRVWVFDLQPAHLGDSQINEQVAHFSKHLSAAPYASIVMDLACSCSSHTAATQLSVAEARTVSSALYLVPFTALFAVEEGTRRPAQVLRRESLWRSAGWMLEREWAIATDPVTELLAHLVDVLEQFIAACGPEVRTVVDDGLRQVMRWLGHRSMDRLLAEQGAFKDDPVLQTLAELYRKEGKVEQMVGGAGGLASSRGSVSTSAGGSGSSRSSTGSTASNGSRVLGVGDARIARGGGNQGVVRSCEACGREGTGLLLCAGCKVVRYCSADCQRVHWKEHRKRCKRGQVTAAGG